MPPRGHCGKRKHELIKDEKGTRANEISNCENAVKRRTQTIKDEKGNVIVGMGGVRRERILSALSLTGILLKPLLQIVSEYAIGTVVSCNLLQ